jgi:hypothetical protein
LDLRGRNRVDEAVNHSAHGDATLRPAPGWRSATTAPGGTAGF